jgi:hypothetical protein
MPNEIKIPTRIAQLILTEGALDLVHASEQVKRALVTWYLRARDWDVEVTFNMREFRDRAQGMSWQQVVENEIYQWAENTYGPQIQVELDRLRSETARERSFA